MSELIGRTGQPMLGRNRCLLCRLVAKRLQEEGSHEPYESRGSRTDLWGAGGEIPPVYPAVDVVSVKEKAWQKTMSGEDQGGERKRTTSEVSK
jgi:hypothetical protein